MIKDMGIRIARTLGLAALLTSAVVTGAWAQATTIEWEDSGSPVSFNGVNQDRDFVANLSMDHDQDLADADLGWAFSNGRAYGLAASWGAPGPKTELMFAGTGVSFRGLRYGGGHESVDWRIESALGGVVASGTANMNGTAENVDVECATAGSLPLGLYKLVLAPGYGESGLMVVDYAQVTSQSLTRVETDSFYVEKTGGWGSDTNFNPSGGSAQWSAATGDTMALTFFGTGIAVVNSYSSNGFGTGLGTFSWSIDGDRNGNIDLSAATYAGFADARRATILASDLEPGVHELVCTVTSTGKPVLMDAFDLMQPLTTTPRYEVENTNPPTHINGVNLHRDFVGQLSTAHQADFSQASLGVDYSNGYAQALADSWPAPGMALDLNFCGSSIAVSLLQYGGAESELNWQLLGAGGAVAQSGTMNLNSGTLARPTLTVTPATAGLYSLRLSGGATATGQYAVVDYFDVDGDTMERMEENDARVWTSPGQWIQGDTFASPSGGTQAVASQPGARLVVEFEGSDIAVVTPFNPNMGRFDWSIDGGAGGSGTVDQAASWFTPADFSDARLSTILAKGLAAGSHQLVLTVAQDNTKNVYIDAFDTDGQFVAVTEVPVAEATPASLMFTDGSGYEVDVVAGDAPTTQAVTIRNTGTADLTFTGGAAGTPGLAISGTDASSFSILSVTPSTADPLVPNGEVTVVIQFDPQVSQRTLDLQATLEVTSDAATLSVALKGDALPAELSAFTIQ